MKPMKTLNGYEIVDAKAREDIEQLKQSGGGGSGADLTNYYTKTEIDNKGYLTSIPSEYVTDTELNNKGYLTQHQDISGKADKVHSHSYNDLTDKPTIPSTEGLATEQFVRDEIAKIDIPEGGGGDVNLDNYYTKTEIDNKGFLTEHQSLENYATKEYVNGLFANIATAEGGSY